MMMERKTLTAREVRESQFFLRAPILAVPLLTLLFWAFGGGKGPVSAKGLANGFVMHLPGPHVVPVTKLDKMGYYELAKKDSAAVHEKERIEDHYARQLGLEEGQVDPVVKKVQDKLGELKLVMAGRRAPVGGGFSIPGRIERPPKEVLDRKQVVANELVLGKRVGAGAGAGDGEGGKAQRKFAVGDGVTGAGSDIKKLEKLVNMLQREEGGNSEIEGLNVVLDKLMAIQKPKEDSGLSSRVVSAERPVVYSVKSLPDEEDTMPGFDSSTIEAVVADQQVLVGNGELRMELSKDILIGGLTIAAGTELYGMATLNGDRLRVVVNGITIHERIFPVRLSVIGQDGLAGIYIPGAPVADATRESASGELGAFGPAMLSTNLAGQAANAGIGLARAVIGKKIRPVKVTVPAGYAVFLHVQNQGL